MLTDLLRFLRDKANTPSRVIGVLAVYVVFAMANNSPFYEPAIAEHEEFFQPLAGFGLIYWVVTEAWSYFARTGMYPASYAELTSLRKKVSTIEERQGRLANTIGEPYWETDKSGRMIFSNHANAELYGSTARELIRSGTAPYIHRDDLQDAYRMFQQAVAGQMGFSLEFEVAHKGVSVRAIRVYAWPLFDDEDNFEGHFGSAEIIEEFKNGDY